MTKVFFSRGGNIERARDEGFSSEEALLDLIERHIELIPAEDILNLEEELPEDQPAFMVIKREAGVVAGSIDLLLVDHRAIPTVVEAKLQTNREIRRAVLGQGLEYVASLATQRAENIWSEARNWHKEKLDEVFQKFQPEMDQETFLKQLDNNLQKGLIQLIILTNKLPRETRLVIEYLNTYSNLLVFGLEVQSITVSANEKIYIIDIFGPSEKNLRDKSLPSTYTDCLSAVRNQVRQGLDKAEPQWRFDPAYVTARPGRLLEFLLLEPKLVDAPNAPWQGEIGYYARVHEDKWHTGFKIWPTRESAYRNIGEAIYAALKGNKELIERALGDLQWKESALRRTVFDEWRSWDCAKEELTIKLAPVIADRLLEWMKTLQPIVQPVLMAEEAQIVKPSIKENGNASSTE